MSTRAFSFLIGLSDSYLIIYPSHSSQSILSNHKEEYILSLPKTLQWLPTDLGVKLNSSA